MRTAKDLLIASKQFAEERRALSWWHLLSTLFVFAGAIVSAALADWLVVRAASSVLAGLVAVRLFIIYHDYQHGAILRGSSLGAWFMHGYGLLMLNPPSVWNRSHNHHHKNNSKTFGASVGSYPIMTPAAFAAASGPERLAYAASRHPLTMLFGYITVFFWSMSLRPFLQSPARHFDAGLAVLVHLAVMIYLSTIGFDTLLFVMLVPSFIAAAFGAYLFYAQHNFPAAKLTPRAEWTHVDAALHSSSYMRMGPLMRWFTGNIGYHHVHHLNSRIPFYRLPETMDALEELQSPGTTTLSLRDVVACLRLKLWSPDEERFVGWRVES